VFVHARNASRTELVRASELRFYRPRQNILSEGESAEQVFALEHGCVRVFHRDASGKESVCKILRAPALFGEAEALSGLRYTEHVEAVTDCEILCMPVSALMRFLWQEPACAVFMLIDVARRLAIASVNQKSLAFEPVTVRLANYLLEYARARDPQSGAMLRVDLTQDDMAAALGVSRRAVASDMALWQREGAIMRGEGGYLIDETALRRYGSQRSLGIVYSLLDADFSPWLAARAGERERIGERVGEREL
jgi:CRP-like cAMP-binding protein